MSAALDLFASRPAALVIRVPGLIRGKARAARRVMPSGFVQTFVDRKTQSAEAWVRQCALEQVGQPVLDGQISLDVLVTVEVPASWSNKKRAAAFRGELRPTGKPDADNTVKLLADAFNKIVWRDDAQVVDLRFRKVYGEQPGAVLTVRELGARA